MPVDPTISLGVTGGKEGPATPGFQPSNPLSLINGITELQTRQLALQTARQTFAAKQKIGKIMAGAGSVTEGLAQAAQDPDVQAWVPDVAQTIQQTQNIAQQYKGQVQGQTADAFQHVGSLLLGGLVDPASVERNLPLVLNNIPDRGIRETVRQSAEHAIQGLSVGMKPNSNNDPAVAQANKDIYTKNLTAAGLATGTLDAMSKLGGTAGTVTAPGGALQPTITAPTLPAPVSGNAPGSTRLAGPPVAQGLQPTLSAPGNLPVNEGQGGQRWTGTDAGNPLAPAPRPSTAPASTSASASEEPSSAPPSQTAGDGSPLIPSGYKLQAPGKKAGVVGGVPIGPAAVISQKLAESFGGEERAAYNNAGPSLALLDEMDRNFDNMSKDGGFMTPGSFGELRAKTAKMLNTIAQANGAVPPFDPSKVASAEDILKGTQRMGPAVLQTLLGQQREAAETIKNMNEKGVPGIENSPLGAKLLISSIAQATKRQMDLYEFKNALAPGNGGDLTGADAAFNKLHPATGYIDKALKEFGLTKDGFRDVGALETAVRNGYLTPSMAAAQAKKQGFKLEK